MKSEWTIRSISDIAEVNPRESLSKGSVAKKIPMDVLQPFTRDIPSYRMEAFKGGTKFRNLDTIMARITPCLENGKTAQVRCLDDGEVGFGSTEYIVFRAKEGVDPDYLYYLICSPLVRNPAIKSMVGSSGRQRVQTSVISALQVAVPHYEDQVKIGGLLRGIDDKIQLNTQINKNLESQAFSYFDYLQGITLHTFTIKYIAELNPTRTIKKGTIARYIGMSDLSTSISFPESWSYAQYKGGVKFVNGDTILAQITPCLENGKIAYIGLLNPDETAFGSTEYIVLSPKDGIPAPFLYCLARNKKFREFAIKNMTGTSGRQRVSATAISSFELKLPSKNQLQQFGSFTTTAFKIITNNGLENQKLAMLRDTLLPKLMSGEIDVSAVDL